MSYGYSNRFQSFGQARPREDARSRATFLRKVYALFFGGIVAATGGALLALNAGAGSSGITVRMGSSLTRVPPLVAWVSQHFILSLLVYFGAFFAVSAVRHVPKLNVAALFGFTFVSGVYIAPLLFIATAMAAGGQTLSASPVRDAFLLATAGFGGLTAYALISRRDFSVLGGFLTMGFFVLLGAMLVGMFIGGEIFQLAIASVGVLLFGAWVLYDTSRLLRSDDRDAVGAALGLYLSFLNIFLFILRILMSSRRD
jgi:modulator of FtsH protease